MPGYSVNGLVEGARALFGYGGPSVPAYTHADLAALRSGQAAVEAAALAWQRRLMWPLDKNMIRGRIRNNTFGKVRNSNTKNHQGWDLQAEVGTPCYSVGNGTVVAVFGKDMKDEDLNKYDLNPDGTKKWHHGYGRTVCVEFFCKPADVALPAQKYFAFYAHLSRIDVVQGHGVSPDCRIGLTGKTGNASLQDEEEDHLHFEIRDVKKPGSGLTGRIDPDRIYGYTPTYAPALRVREGVIRG